MMHLMMRNRFALGKFMAMMLVIVFMVSIPAAAIGTAASNQKQAAIREAMDEVLARIKEKGVITLEDYEELKDVLDSAGGAGKYELDINIVRPHEHQHVDDVTAWLPEVRTDMPLAPDPSHEHSEACLARDAHGNIVDYHLRCGPHATGTYTYVKDGETHICTPCTDGKYIVTGITMNLPENILEINGKRMLNVGDVLSGTDPYELGPDGYMYSRLSAGFTIQYADGDTAVYNGFQGNLNSGFGTVIRFTGSPATATDGGVAYQYTLPANACLYFYGYSEDSSRTAFYKSGNVSFEGSSLGGLVLYRSEKCPYCGTYYIPENCISAGSVIQCPYCAEAFVSYAANYSQTNTLYLNNDADGLGDFQMKGVHPDRKEEIITGWTYDSETFAQKGEFFLTVQYSEDGAIDACNPAGAPWQYAFHNRGQLSIKVSKTLCHCDSTANHPDGEVLYYMCSDDGTGTECPYCSRMPQSLALGHTGDIESPYPGWTALEEVLTNVKLTTGKGDVELPYVAGGSSASKGWTYKPATADELAEEGLANTRAKTWYHIKAWDYFTYRKYDPETFTFSDVPAGDNEFDAYIAVTNTLKKCPHCEMLYPLNADGTDPGCPYCAKKILGIKIYCRGTDIEATSLTVKDYYFGSPEDIASVFDIIAEYADGHTENISETHPDWIAVTKPSGTSLVPVGIQPGKQTVTIALMGTGGGTTMLADTSVGMYRYVPDAQNPTGAEQRAVTVINHTASDTVQIIQRMYRCPNEFPETGMSEDLPGAIAEDGHHYILADEDGVCPDECPTCSMLLTDIECTLNPMKYQVSEYGWDDVENTFLKGQYYFRAKSLDGRYYGMAPAWWDYPLDSTGAEYGQLYFVPYSYEIDYTPGPGWHTAKITLINPSLAQKREDSPYQDQYVGRSAKYYGPDGQEYYASVFGYLERTFEIQILQDVCHCDECGRYYHTDADGNDPGCPYCGHKVVSIAPDAETYRFASLEAVPDLRGVVTITAAYSDGTESSTYTDGTGEHPIAEACLFVPHDDDPLRYTVTYTETVTFTPCDKYGAALEPETVSSSASCEIELALNVTQCEVCGHYYLGGKDAECPYCALKIESIEADVDTIVCSPADLSDFSGYFKVYGVHPSKEEDPTPQYPDGRTLGGEKTEIPYSSLTVTYTPGRLSVTYTYSGVAECLTEAGEPFPVTISDTRALTIAVTVSGKVECPRCHYFYDLGEDAKNFSSSYDIQGHCPYCDYVFYGADGSRLNGFSTVLFKSYAVGSDETIEPGTAKLPGTQGTQAQPGTYAVIAKGTGINQILADTAVEMDTKPGQQTAIQLGEVAWAEGAVRLTVTADPAFNAYNPDLTGYQTFTARYTATFSAYDSADAPSAREITQTCDVTLLLDVYDSCRLCSRMFSARAGHGRCPHCSLDHIEVTPTELAEELGILRNIRPYIAVVATFADGHTEAITDGDNTAGHDYTDNFNSSLRGTQNVTISLTDAFDSTKTATVKVTLSGYWVCPTCLTRYLLNEDGTNPACEECAHTYVQITAEPGSIRKEWSSSMGADAIKDWLSVRVKTKDGQWHSLGPDDYTTDFMPSRGTGSSAVTVSAQDGYGNTVSCNVTVTLWKKYTCGICGHEYDAAPDGSDPGCPICPSFVTGYEAGLNKTAYNLDEEPDLYFRCVYRDGHKEDKLASTTNNFDSRTAGERELVFSYLGERISGGTYTVINNYLVTCPACGTENDTRVTGYDVSEKGYCPNCEYDIMRLDVRASSSWLVPGTANRVYYGSEPDVIVEFVARNGTRTEARDYEISGFDPYNTTSSQTITATSFGYTGYLEILVIKRGSPEDVIEAHPGAVITIDGVGYAVCPVCGEYYKAGLASCPYCDFAARYSAFIDDPDSNPGFRLKAGSAEYEAFSNVINGDSELIVLDEILDRLYELPGIIEQVNQTADPAAKAGLLGLTREDRDEYLKAYSDLALLEAKKAADPSYAYTDGELGQMAYLRGVIDLFEAPGYVLQENDIVVVTIRKIRPNVFDYINNLFSTNYEATYFTASAVISKRY